MVFTPEDYTEEQLMVRAMASDFIEKEVMPGQSAFVYFNMPEKDSLKWKSFEWVWAGNQLQFEGKGKKSNKFEDLT